MKNLLLRSRFATLLLATSLTGGAALSLAQTSRRPTAQAPSPKSHLLAVPDSNNRGNSDRDLRSTIEDLENSSPDDINTGRVGRFFTDPAVIITNGRMHRIDWGRIRADRSLDRTPQDVDPRDRAERPDTQVPDVHIESFQTRHIDSHTVVAIYTAVIPDADGLVRQPVVATLVQEPGSSVWRVASYTAEDAAIPGDAEVDNTDRAPLRGR